VAVWSSPLEPALRTAEEIAARSGVPVRVDHGLRDWTLTDRWKGHGWGEIPTVFPGELEVYLGDPTMVAFAEETLAQVADRVAEVARRLDRDHPHGDVVVVSHQDAVQAGRLRLVGSRLETLHDGTPGHATVMTLRPGLTWREETVWSPGESPRFGERSDLRVLAGAEDPMQPTSA
jgi:broad specificity phosphatase PhoE